MADFYAVDSIRQFLSLSPAALRRMDPFDKMLFPLTTEEVAAAHALPIDERQAANRSDSKKIEREYARRMDVNDEAVDDILNDPTAEDNDEQVEEAQALTKTNNADLTALKDNGKNYQSVKFA